MTVFRDLVPKDVWNDLLDDVMSQQRVRRHESVDDMIEQWIETATAIASRHRDPTLRRILDAIEKDPEGAKVFFANVYKYMTLGETPDRWTE